MPNVPDRETQQPQSPQQRKRQQLKDKALQEALQEHNEDAAEEEQIETPGGRHDDTRLRTEGAGETGEDEDLPEENTRGNSNPGNFANDREKASEAGRKGGKR